MRLILDNADTVQDINCVTQVTLYCSAVYSQKKLHYTAKSEGIFSLK